eukprot:5292877-Prymnesium_polylepis.1
MGGEVEPAEPTSRSRRRPRARSPIAGLNRCRVRPDGVWYVRGDGLGGFRLPGRVVSAYLAYLAYRGANYGPTGSLETTGDDGG